MVRSPFGAHYEILPSSEVTSKTGDCGVCNEIVTQHPWNYYGYDLMSALEILGC